MLPTLVSLFQIVLAQIHCHGEATLPWTYELKILYFTFTQSFELCNGYLKPAPVLSMAFISRSFMCNNSNKILLDSTSGGSLPFFLSGVIKSNCRLTTRATTFELPYNCADVDLSLDTVKAAVDFNSLSYVLHRFNY